MWFQTRRFFMFSLYLHAYINHIILRVWPRGGTLIFSYIRRLGPFFGGLIFEFQYFLGFKKNEYFFGYEHLWVFFLGVIPKLD